MAEAPLLLRLRGKSREADPQGEAFHAQPRRGREQLRLKTQGQRASVRGERDTDACAARAEPAWGEGWSSSGTEPGPEAPQEETPGRIVSGLRGQAREEPSQRSSPAVWRLTGTWCAPGRRSRGSTRRFAGTVVLPQGRLRTVSSTPVPARWSPCRGLWKTPARLCLPSGDRFAPPGSWPGVALVAGRLGRPLCVRVSETRQAT